jgi:tRNA 2-thiouridine synthesizing protein A
MDDDGTLDLRGLKCPLPALLAKKALAKAAPGTMLRVLADDPLAAVDIPHMCHGEGHGVDSVTEADGHRVFTIRCGSGPAADGLPPTGG